MSGQEKPNRWSDDRLEIFYAEFQAHLKKEDEERRQQAELHTAIFRKENKDDGTTPGLMQLCVRMSEDVTRMKIADDRQKRFIGGIVFAFTCMGFFFTDAAHKLLDMVKRL